MKSKVINKKKLESIYELPERSWRMFEEYNLPTPSEMWEIELEIETEDGDPPIPDDFFVKSYVHAIEKQRYEEAAKIKEELIERGFTITTEFKEGKNKGTITFSKKDGWIQI